MAMKNFNSSKNGLNFTLAYKSKNHREDVIVRSGSLASEMSASTRGGDYSTPYCPGRFKFFYADKKDRRKVNIRKSEVSQNQTGKMRETNSLQGNGTNEFKINIWPCTWDVVVGTKFVNIFSGKFLFQVSNTQGQTVFSEDLMFSMVSREITTLQRGMYWLRLIEVTSHLSCVNQLLFK